jgi:5-(carboxyamino)imidazole ribonucleotide mutase
MVAALTPLPVIGVPVASRHLQGIDSLYSIVQMPAGIPVATVAIGNAKNAGLLAIQILASHDPALLEKVQHYRQSLKQMVIEKQAKLEELGSEGYLKELMRHN